MCAAAGLMLSGPAIARGATLTWKGPNAAMYFGLPFNCLEFENSVAGTEFVLSHKVLNWRDADFGWANGAP